MNNPIEEGLMDPREEGAVHPAMPQGTIGRGAQTSDEVQLATDRPQTNDRRKTHATGRSDSVNWGHAYQGINHPSDSNGMENPEPLSEGRMLKRSILGTQHQWTLPLNI